MICTNADLEDELKNQLFEEITEDDHLLWNRGKRYKLLPSIVDNFFSSRGLSFCLDNKNQVLD